MRSLDNLINAAGRAANKTNDKVYCKAKGWLIESKVQFGDNTVDSHAMAGTKGTHRITKVGQRH